MSYPFYESAVSQEIAGSLNAFICGERTFKAIDLLNILSMLYGVKNDSTFYTMNLHPETELFYEDSATYRTKMAFMYNVNQFNDLPPKWLRGVFNLERTVHRFSRRVAPVKQFYYYGADSNDRAVKQRESENAWTH